ncbi:hypothetical protein [Mycolicibacterium fortuitum]
MGGDQASRTGQVVDTSAQPKWERTGYKYFPYAAQQSGQWWVLRLNTDFPDHDMYTLFVDGQAAVDVTGNPGSDLPLVATLAALKPASSDEPTLDPETAREVVAEVSAFADYGSEAGDPCIFCADNRDGLTPDR